MDERMHENEIHANTKRQNEGTWNWKWLLKFHSHARNWNNLFYSKKSQSQNYSKMDHLRHHSQKWVIIRDPQTEYRTQEPLKRTLWKWKHNLERNIAWKHTQLRYLETQWLSWNHKLTRNQWYSVGNFTQFEVSKLKVMFPSSDSWFQLIFNSN